MRYGNCYRVTVKGEHTLAYVIEADNRQEAQEKAMAIADQARSFRESVRDHEVTRVRELHAARTHSLEGTHAARRAA